MAKQIVVTETGFQKLKDELDYLKSVKRKEAAENVGIARGFGDLAENSEYDEAKNEQAKVEAKILELEDMVSHVKIISDHEIHADTVSVGTAVTIQYVDDEEDDESICYKIVGSREVNLEENKISDQSPIGKALIGTKVGDIVTIEVPAGEVHIKITGIEKQ